MKFQTITFVIALSILTSAVQAAEPGKPKTPMDQGSSKDDLEITTQIRKAIIAQKGMSVNAQNVKIITTNGRVTLRGPVNTADEKRIIEEFAIKATRKGSVDNQLEVK